MTTSYADPAPVPTGYGTGTMLIVLIIDLFLVVDKDQGPELLWCRGFAPCCHKVNITSSGCKGDAPAPQIQPKGIYAIHHAADVVKKKEHG